MGTRTFHTRSDHRGIVRLEFPVDARDAQVAVEVTVRTEGDERPKAPPDPEEWRERLRSLSGKWIELGIEPPPDDPPDLVEPL